LRRIVTTDRTSNGPLLVYPRSQGMGGSPTTENWVLDSFAADPNTGQALVATAENVAQEGRISRRAVDDLTMLRWQQYQGALAADRAFQRRYMQPVVLARGKGRKRPNAHYWTEPDVGDSARSTSTANANAEELL
jgi:hypothetical protein